MLFRMVQAYKVALSVFHTWFSPLITFIGLFILHLVVSIGMVLDHLFFPSLRHTQIEKPIIIVGNPRSGTTFLQRFLVQNGYGAGMRIWKMLYPSLLLQSLLKPFLPLLEKMSPARFHSKAAHDTSLTGIETDDPSIFFRYFDGLFLYGFFLAWAEDDLRSLFDPKFRDTSDRDFTWLEKMWKRNLIGEKQKRMVAKIFSLGIRMVQFLRRFPDAKIIYLVRDPLQTVPSGLSLVTSILDSRFGFWNLPNEKKNQYIERLYASFLELSLRFHHDYTNGNIPKENIMIVQYNRLMQDFENVMSEINEFVGMIPSEVLIKTIQKTGNQQTQYKSKHTYNLKRFKLTESRIRNDYALIYMTFLKTKIES